MTEPSSHLILVSLLVVPLGSFLVPLYALLALVKVAMVMFLVMVAPVMLATLVKESLEEHILIRKIPHKSQHS